MYQEYLFRVSVLFLLKSNLIIWKYDFLVLGVYAVIYTVEHITIHTNDEIFWQIKLSSEQLIHIKLCVWRYIYALWIKGFIVNLISTKPEFTYTSTYCW